MSAGAPWLSVAAPAKINLYLHVLGRRADGYHLLDSLIAFADVCDTVSARPAAGLSLALTGPFAPALMGENDNLVLRAARALAGAGGVAAGAEIRLHKGLPVAAGLGGGSADAAAALKVLTRLWRLGPGTVDIAGLAAALGADVPACLAGRAAFMGGIGDKLEAAPELPEVALVLVNPGSHVPTAAVYANWGGPPGRPARFAEPVADARALARLLAERGNDLTAAAAALAPDIGVVLDRLAARPGCLAARMSGSGATCFGVFADRDSAARAAAALAEERTDWWVRPARLVTDSRALPPPAG